MGATSGWWGQATPSGPRQGCRIADQSGGGETDMLTGLNDLMLSLYTRAHVARQALLERQEGQALVEYTLILALVSVVAIATLTTLGEDIVTKLKEITTA